MSDEYRSHFDENRRRFAERFPDLAHILGLDSDELSGELLSRIPADYALVNTPSGIPTISVRGVFIQSKYDPARDADRAFSAFESSGSAASGRSTGTAQPADRTGNAAGKPADGAVFQGIALALVPELFARRHPDSTIVVLEPDVFLFLLCLAARPLDALFAHRRLIFLIGTQPREVSSLIEKLDLGTLPSYENPAIMTANKPWFDEYAALRKRDREKKEINANTLRRFGDLWLSNMSRNLGELRDRDGIRRFEGAFADQSVLILAAGPSLDRVLPRLPSLRRTCVIIAVDTAVRACVRAGVEPDFIVLVDPQYWNWRHLDGVDSPSSILITESAAWPAVFRFRCRGIFLCSSLFPLGQFLEKRTEKRGTLGAGGSVSTTAWDFARFLGSKNVLMAGLDLGFPDRKTHFTGSIFEDRTHTVSGRLSPSETAGYLALYGAGPYPVPDYLGGTVLTDKRLILYAWWFESRLAQYPDCKTSTLTPEGVRIPGFAIADIDDAAHFPESRDEIDRRLARLTEPEAPEEAETTGNTTDEPEDAARNTDRQSRIDRFNRAFDELLDALRDLERLAMRGLALCDRYDRMEGQGKEQADILADFDELDRHILSHRAKEVTAMVFASDAKRPGSEANACETAQNEGDMAASRAMYRSIAGAIAKNLDALSNFIKESGRRSDN